jgi:hypothetical protein
MQARVEASLLRVYRASAARVRASAGLRDRVPGVQEVLRRVYAVLARVQLVIVRVHMALRNDRGRVQIAGEQWSRENITTVTESLWVGNAE